MEYSLDLFKSSITDPEKLETFLYNCSTFKSFIQTKNKIQETVAFINSSLTKNENNEQNLLALEQFFLQCPKNVLGANIYSWIRYCLKNLVNFDDGSISSAAFKLLGKLICSSIDFPEVRKEVACSIIPKIMGNFLKEGKSNKEGVNDVLQCLLQTLKSYGKASGLQKEEITKLVLSFLESSDENVTTCAQCYCALAATGSSGSNFENYLTNLRTQQKFLLNTLHGLLDSLFENIDLHQEGHKVYELGNYNYSIPEVVEKDMVIKKKRLATQFKNVSQFLSYLLLDGLGAEVKNIPFLGRPILKLISRGLFLNYSMLKNLKETADKSSLSAVISIVYLSCLNLLKNLIYMVEDQLLPYNSIISRIIHQVLSWTQVQDWPYGVERHLSAVRVEVYECAAYWLNVAEINSDLDTYLDDVLQYILTDIDINPPSLSLRAPNNKGKRKGKKFRQQKDVQFTFEYTVDKLANKKTCNAALELLRAILSNIPSLIKPKQHLLLQKVIVRKIYKIQHTRAEETLPYSDELCRLNIYKSLFALCNCHCFKVMYDVFDIFSEGTKDNSQQVAKFCYEALSNINTMLQMSYLPLEFPCNDLSTRSNFEISRNEHNFSRLGNKQNLSRSQFKKTNKRNSVIHEKTTEESKTVTLEIRTEKEPSEQITEDSAPSTPPTIPDEVHEIPEILVSDDDDVPNTELCILSDNSIDESEVTVCELVEETPVRVKRDLEDKDGDESLFNKRCKLNGENDEQLITTLESSDDEELLSSFVDKLTEDC